ncbi:hypothetical protein [Prosthecobacter fluviatilis]|uniref:Uncharacterized protein n=1 Tax=Prosthecobacter fluviatilis TaxID=445931 RepID=A0ABW0KY62_9BACT
MNETDQRLEQLASRARSAPTVVPEELPYGFVTRVLAASTEMPDSSTLWARFSLGALPVAAVATAACLWWSAGAMSADAHDLAQVFIQTPLFP